jgi:UDP-N-acetylglucosamine 2-epimerase
VKLLSIAGARPQFVKLWPIATAVARRREAGEAIEHAIVHTGQHYSPEMSAAFFDDLAIPEPTMNLGIGSGSHGAQTGRMLAAVETAMQELAPDVVVLYGDTNSTLAGGLAAAKLGLPIVHVEAGLRCGDQHMPEEINRVVTDHVADLLLAPTATAVGNLEREGLAARTLLTGDVMYDAWLASLPRRWERLTDTLQRLDVQPQCFALVTVHRAANVETRLASIIEGLNRVAAEGRPVLFPVHPRTAAALARAPHGLHPAIRLVPPLGYLDMAALLEAASVVITDSGGVQKEAFFAGCPCVTLREDTEWVETVHRGANVLAGHDPERIAGAVRHWERFAPPRALVAERAAGCYGHGEAAARIVDAIVRLGAGRHEVTTC